MAGSTTRGAQSVPVATTIQEIIDTIAGSGTTAINGAIVPAIALFDSTNPDRKVAPLGPDSGLALDTTLTAGNVKAQILAAALGMPIIHRLSVTSSDGADPATSTSTSASLPNSSVIGTQASRTVQYDIQLTCSAGGAMTTVQPMVWLPAITYNTVNYGGYWSSLPAQTLVQVGTSALSTLVTAVVAGRSSYLKILSLSGTSASVTVLATPA